MAQHKLLPVMSAAASVSLGPRGSTSEPTPELTGLGKQGKPSYRGHSTQAGEQGEVPGPATELTSPGSCHRLDVKQRDDLCVFCLCHYVFQAKQHTPQKELIILLY